MKNIYCKACLVMYTLTLERKSCECGRTWGELRPTINEAAYGGDMAVPIEVSNVALSLAIENAAYNRKQERAVDLLPTAFVASVASDEDSTFQRDDG